MNGVASELTGSKLKVLHTFCASLGDGCNPSSVYTDAKGRLVRTTSGGQTGTDSNGTACEIRP